MIDGARMVTPGILENVLAARRITERAVVVIPGYHLGPDLQKKTVRIGYDEETEARLLEQIRWPEDGYRLFEVATLSGSGSHGYFKPIAECNCLLDCFNVYY